MANYEAFFNGSQYPFEKSTVSSAYLPSTKDIAYPSDPLTANQLKKVSDKISTGAQTIEVSGLGLTGAGPMKHLASVPKQHWKEIDRLRQLTGVDLTFHGPLVDPTGVTGRGNWSEDQRVEAERQMKAAVELAQQMNSDDKNKGIVMTFHSNNGLPEVERKVVVGRNPDGTPKEKTVQMAVYNERTGQIGNIPAPKEDYYEGGETNITKDLEKFNEDQWRRQLESVFVNNTRVSREMIEALGAARQDDEKIRNRGIGETLFKFYNIYEKNPDNYKQGLNELSKSDPQLASYINNGVTNLQNAQFFVKESHSQLKELYNEAYGQAKRDNNKPVLNKLDSYANELKSAMKKFEDTGNFVELQDKITYGTRLLRETDIKPTLYKPLKEFAVDKGSDTFANVALHAWQNAKKNHLAPGIISIENPPAGMSGLTRAEEIIDLVKASREKFVERAVEQKLMSEKEAKATAEKIIGATWDVGHINSIQKWGYNRKDVLAQAEKISKYVKHMHIADNLGFEDAELPAGMGNVPIDEILNASWGENFRKAKKAIETGDWFSRQGGLGMTKTPVTESLSGLTAPVYSMGSQESPPYWNSSVHPEAGYFGGLGP